MFSEAYETFEEHKEEWLAEHRGEYVVIAAYQVLGFFPSLDQAYDAGHRRYGPGVFFLVMRVVDYDQPGRCLLEPCRQSLGEFRRVIFTGEEKGALLASFFRSPGSGDTIPEHLVMQFHDSDQRSAVY